jgi:hypothetical protein
MAQTLARLPTEILVRICECLNQIDAPSVLSFALANKHCHSIAKGHLFRRLTFSITTPSRLRAHLQKCTNLLERNQAFAHVKRVVLVGTQGFDAQAFLRNSGKKEKDRVNHHRWNLAAAPSLD